MSNYERRKAMMEAERYSACEDFFIVDSYRMHMSRQGAFEAGFERAWDKQSVIIDELLEALEIALKTTYSASLHAEWTALIAKAKGEV